MRELYIYVSLILLVTTYFTLCGCTHTIFHRKFPLNHGSTVNKRALTELVHQLEEQRDRRPISPPSFTVIVVYQLAT